MTTPATSAGSDAAPILPVMMGTAGHVDHGKTRLVAHLTGVDTDRLKEEKSRRLSIDLGFAPCRLEDGSMFGIVDVPGHEDFIRNMVAGASSLNLVLLVVAADDGIMPQTREHLILVRLLGIPRLVAALTKTDLVDSEWRTLVETDLRDCLNASGYRDRPIIPVSSATGEGLETLRETLNRTVHAIEPPRDDRAFRLHVARAFTLKGLGTVATGVPVSGSLRPGDRVDLLPAGGSSPVRDIQTYHRPSSMAEPHRSCALNLRDLPVDRVRRGMTLALPDVYRATTSILASVTNVSDSISLRGRPEWLFHLGTACVSAQAKLLGAQEIPPGESGFVQLHLAEPVTAAAGDPYILRRPSPSSTVGGGRVLSADHPPNRRARRELLPYLEQAQSAIHHHDYLLSELLVGPRPILALDELKPLTQLSPERAADAIRAQERHGELIPLGPERWAVRRRWPDIAERMKRALQRYHRHHPYTWGMEPSHATRLLGLPPSSFPQLGRLLQEDPAITLKHGHLALADFSPAISSKQMEWLQAIESQLTSAGVQAPAHGDLMKSLQIPEAELKRLLRLLTEERKVVTIGGKNWMLRSVYDECRQRLLELFQERSVVDLGLFRQATGLSRNLAVAILEQFDQEGLTRRVENGRVLQTTQSPRSRPPP